MSTSNADLARDALPEVPTIRRSPPVHWPTVIGELQEHAGLSLSQIGDALDVPKTTVNAWFKPVMRGGELRHPATPRYEDGKALLELHALMSAQIQASKHCLSQVVRHDERSRTVRDYEPHGHSQA